MRILIFDLDGTLVNSLPDIAGAMNHSLTACGLPPHPVEAYRLMVGNGAVKLTERACAPHSEKEAEVYRRYRARYSAHLAEETHPYPGMPEALRALRAMGYALAVISNKNQADVEQVLSHCFPGFAFDAAVGLLEGEPLKPDPAPANRMLARLGA
ncbi:MAG: HAD hydrolase-like protein [Clostridia bacterium]|nr:HAD hydrolase-like protein [Clostridia bacterium]